MNIVIAITMFEILVIWSDTRAGDVHMIAAYPPGFMACAEAVADAVSVAHSAPIEVRNYLQY